MEINCSKLELLFPFPPTTGSLHLKAYSVNVLAYLEIQRQLVGSEDTQLYLRHTNFQIFKVVSLLCSTLFNNLVMEVFIIVFNFCIQTKHTDENRLYINKYRVMNAYSVKS